MASKWDLQKEIRNFAERCTNISPRVARQKASQLFKKYEGLLYYSEYDKECREKEIEKLRLLNICLKTGQINYQVKGAGYCSILISEIFKVETNKGETTVFFKNGQSETFGEDFEWIQELF